MCYIPQIGVEQNTGEWGGRHVTILNIKLNYIKIYWINTGKWEGIYKVIKICCFSWLLQSYFHPKQRISQNLATLQHSASLERSGWSSGLGGTSWRQQSRSRMLREWSHLARATPASAPNWRTASPPRPSLSTAGSGRRAVNWEKSYSQWKLSPGSTIW